MATKPWKLFEFENGQILAGLTYGDEESSVTLTSTLKYDDNDCPETKTFIFDVDEDGSYRKGEKFFEQLSQENVLEHFEAKMVVIS